MERLRAIAETAGYFTREEAFAAGHNDRSINREIRTRLWRRVRPGAYTFADLWPASDQDAHRLTARAACRKFGDGVATSHTTAAIDHGLLVWRLDLSLVHLTRLDRGSGRTQAGVCHHEGVTVPGDVVRMDGRWVMNATRAAIEAASLGSSEAGLVTLDSLLHLGKGDRAGLDATFAYMQHWPDMHHVALPVRLADPRPESVGESRSRWLFYAQGLPRPELQFSVHDDTGRLVGITDFAWPEHKLLGEFDGKVKYGRLLRPDEAPQDAVFREKRREDQLCEVTGWRMVRLIWANLYDPGATAGRIRRLMRLAA
jgi:hypothetical protein